MATCISAEEQKSSRRPTWTEKKRPPSCAHCIGTNRGLDEPARSNQPRSFVRRPWSTATACMPAHGGDRAFERATQRPALGQCTHACRRVLIERSRGRSSPRAWLLLPVSWHWQAEKAWPCRDPAGAAPAGALSGRTGSGGWRLWPRAHGGALPSRIGIQGWLRGATDRWAVRARRARPTNWSPSWLAVAGGRHGRRRRTPNAQRTKSKRSFEIR